MFNSKTYIQRRKALQKKVGSGLILFLGNHETPMNYEGNTYSFRQDSSFLYYWGIDLPGFAAVIDADENKETLYGNDFAMDDIVWMGPQPKVNDLAKQAGVKQTASLNKLSEKINEAISNGRAVHYLPQYKHKNILWMEELTGINHAAVNKYVSPKLTKAVIEQRSIKSSEEVAEIEFALDISYEMQTYAMRFTRPDIYERDIAGAIAGIASSMGQGISFPIIFSIHGETLHNHYHENLMKKGQLVVNDSGAESLLHYASDITRTFPVDGKFTSKQKEIYEIVLKAQMDSIKEIKPGKKYKDVHLKAAKIIANGLKDLGLMKGDINQAVKDGAHALFFPHGLGHMMGLDVHDLEGLGENLVGYTKKLQRSDQFGLAYLRLAKELEPGFVLTVEPGIYFIPELIDMWKLENKLSQYINFKKVDEYRDFGGIRIEDDVLVEKNGNKVLGKKEIPKKVEDVEEICNSIKI